MPFRILFLFLILSCTFSKKRDSNVSYWQKEGEIFGTTYNIIIEVFHQSIDISILEKNINEIFFKIDDAFSLYKKDSKISKLNKNENVNFDEIEIKIFILSQEICLKSNAYFFPYNRNVLKQLSVNIPLIEKNYIQICNLYNIEKKHNHYYIKKQYPFIEFDFNAIAKGYTVDLIKKLLEQNHIHSYLIEIGGEICVGNSPRKNPEGWMIALESYNSNPMEKQLDEILHLKNICLASSGNYYEDHIFNPFQNKILKKNKRVTVFGPSCAIADAYATLILSSSRKYLYSNEYFINIIEE